MTKEEWLSLRRGDIIIENNSGIARRIIYVSHQRQPGHIKTRTCITLRKIGHGSTKSPNTTYNNYDDRGRWRKSEEMKPATEQPEQKRKKVIVEDGAIVLTSDVVRELADGVKKMRTHANDRLVVLLLQDMTGLPRKDIQAILDAIPQLEKTYYKVKAT